MNNSKNKKKICKNGETCKYFKRNKCIFYHPSHHLNYTPETKIENPAIKWFFNKTPHFKMHSKSEHKQCAICLEEYKKDNIITQLYCNHAYHHKCIEEWLINNIKCPLCKQDFRKYPQYQEHSDFQGIEEDVDGESDFSSSFVEHISVGHDDEYQNDYSDEEQEDWYYNDSPNIEQIGLESDSEQEVYENSDHSDIEIDLPYQINGTVAFTTNFGHLEGEVNIHYEQGYGGENDLSDQQW